MRSQKNLAVWAGERLVAFLDSLENCINLFSWGSTPTPGKWGFTPLEPPKIELEMYKIARQRS
jgi:hypothetical protein